MNAIEIIRKKRDKEELSPDEIEFLVQGITDESIPDYQIAAWAMAVLLNGMNSRETADLTRAMASSGDMADLSAIPGIKVDKHSTGGVGDKTSLAVVPLVAAAGVPVAKMSGRGLGHTGGTIDKLESIPGLKTDLPMEAFIAQVQQIGAAIISQSGNLVPADKRLYALRDVTATVDSLPLIASSVMSKKIAAGADRILLDVKAGSGAFMKNLAAARELARVMIDIGRQTGRQVAAIISSMESPLGRMIGNSLEVRESIDILRGQGPADLREICLELSAAMLWLAEAAPTLPDARQKCSSLLDNGQALEKFLELVRCQGGCLNLDEPSYGLPAARLDRTLVSSSSGYLLGWDAYKAGLASVALGAGRRQKFDQIDYTAGIELLQAPGAYVHKGDELAVLYSSQPCRLEEGATLMKSALIMASEPRPLPPLILDRLFD